MGLGCIGVTRASPIHHELNITHKMFIFLSFNARLLIKYGSTISALMGDTFKELKIVFELIDLKAIISNLYDNFFEFSFELMCSEL